MSRHKGCKALTEKQLNRRLERWLQERFGDNEEAKQEWVRRARTHLVDGECDWDGPIEGDR